MEFLYREKRRGDCFRLLAACYYQPEKDLFLQEDVFKNLAALTRQVSPEAAAAAEEMERSFSRESEEQLTLDYARLFVGPHELLAPPFGSVYLDGERRVMGDSTLEVIKTYEQQGLAMDGEFRNLPDHITVELEFMYYLTLRETEALERADMTGAIRFIGLQQQFLDRHLKRWVPPFCDQVKAGAACRFYRALADCTSLFIAHAQPGEGLPAALQA